VFWSLVGVGRKNFSLGPGSTLLPKIRSSVFGKMLLGYESLSVGFVFLSVLSAFTLVLECIITEHGIRALFFGVCKFCMGFGIKKVALCIWDLV
jgi:hypothetical protein